MSAPIDCDALHPFVDGELDEREAEAYREHLAGCERCQAELPRVVALGERLAELAGPTEPGQARDDRVREAAARDEVARPTADVVPLRPRRRRAFVVGALALAAAAAIILALGLGFGLGRRRGGPTRGGGPVELLASADHRPTPMRFAYAGAAAYHPYDPSRGAADAALVPIAILSRLDAAHDWHGLAIAAFLGGNHLQAEAYLGRADATDDVIVDRAAMIAAATTDAGEQARALALLDDVLRRAPSHAAARWNRAQVLARLGLARLAARAFEELAADHEPGWSDEAARTATSLRAAAAAEEDGWNADWAAGLRLVADGTLPPPGRAAARPGIYRLMLYDAVRAAPSADRVRALRPLALELDAPTGAGVLTAYVDRIAALPAKAFAARAPLAARYRAMIVDDAAPADVDGFLADLRRAGPAADDLRLGVLYWPGPVTAHRPEYDALVAASGDP
ncbi:MAG TPA: zf-HC2 domain-containing protein, partial [Kofleriaceae bacterium]|nr:zf-HC2 domain-containing protein [Kofleriaceae bacterium]